MSVEVMSWVLRHSEVKLGQRLVLLSLADHANSDGTGAWPSVDTIAHEARLSRRQAQRCLRELESSGHIRNEGKSPHGTTIWGVVLSPPTTEGASSTADQGASSAPSPGVADVARTVLVKQPSEEQPSLTPPATRQLDGRNIAFDALAEEAGIVEGDPRLGEVAAALNGRDGIRALFWRDCVRYVTDRAGNVDEAVELGHRLQVLHRNEEHQFERALEAAIHTKAGKYRRAMDGAMLTPGALRKWWVSVESMQDKLVGLTPDEIRRMGDAR